MGRTFALHPKQLENHKIGNHKQMKNKICTNCYSWMMHARTSVYEMLTEVIHIDIGYIERSIIKIYAQSHSKSNNYVKISKKLKCLNLKVTWAHRRAFQRGSLFSG